jgi:hypothetical protein
MVAILTEYSLHADELFFFIVAPASPEKAGD